jgi:hypothetical protein
MYIKKIIVEGTSSKIALKSFNSTSKREGEMRRIVGKISGLK